MVLPGKQAIVLSEEAFSKGESAADYWIIEDELDDERRASRLWEKIASKNAERGHMIFRGAKADFQKSRCED